MATGTASISKAVTPANILKDFATGTTVPRFIVLRDILVKFTPPAVFAAVTTGYVPSIYAQLFAIDVTGTDEIPITLAKPLSLTNPTMLRMRLPEWLIQCYTVAAPTAFMVVRCYSNAAVPTGNSVEIRFEVQVTGELSRDPPQNF